MRSKLIHLPSGQKKCHICAKVFCDASRIKRHLLSHSGKKPFLCPLCGWGFYQKCNMDRHLASHAKVIIKDPDPGSSAFLSQGYGMRKKSGSEIPDPG
jgi:uncharacterized Zn-finger protein